MKRYGNNYGGWFLEPSLIKKGSTVISAGVGEDVSFDLDLQREKQVKIVAIDPTEKAQKFLEQQEELTFDFLPVPLYGTEGHVKIFKNKIAGHVSESVLPSHHAADNDFYEISTLTLDGVMKMYEDDTISVIKMDIEGAEYSVIESLSQMSVPQICVEFHHFCTDKKMEDTMACIMKLKEMGYVIGHNRNFKEITFIHEDAS